MKKILALILTGVMLLSLPACGLNASTREPNKLDVVQATADTAFVYTSFETKRLSAGSEVPLDTKAEVTAQDIITKEQALEIALNNAGLTVDKVYDLEVDLDKEKTGLFWEVDFETLEVEYDYDIDATTGEIVKNKQKPQKTEVKTETKVEVTVDVTITKEQALEIALNNAGLTVDKVYDLEVDLDKEKTGLFWEVDFETLEVEYDYDIDATTGEIVKNRQKPQKTEVKTETKVEVTGDVTITKEQALEIALNNAGLTVDQVYDLEVELDKEKTGTVWEVDFETLANEYEYKIDVTTGQIVKNKIEVND